MNFKDNLKFIKHLDKKGIPSDILRYDYKVLYEYPLFKKYRKYCPNSKSLTKRITTIPVHPGIKKEHLDYIASVINNYKNK
jgi:dTDP-4-amino-4,6-dideoxygalactose transaminase